MTRRRNIYGLDGFGYLPVTIEVWLTDDGTLDTVFSWSAVCYYGGEFWEYDSIDGGDLRYSGDHFERSEIDGGIIHFIDALDEALDDAVLDFVTGPVICKW